MQNQTLDIRYYGETHCKLSCKNCYLGFSEEPAKQRHFDYTTYPNVSVNHYLNLQSSLVDTEILFYKDLEKIKFSYFSNPKQNHFYSLITDIATYAFIAKDPYILSKSLEGLQPTFSLSFKKNSDLNYLLLPHYQTRQYFAFSFIHGIDRPEWFPKILNHCIETNNFLTLMFNKPLTFTKESIKALMEFYVKYPSIVTIDSCISKLVNGYDCTKQENNPNFQDLEVDIQSNSFYRCAYTTNSCIVSLDNFKYPKLTPEDISYITSL